MTEASRLLLKVLNTVATTGNSIANLAHAVDQAVRPDLADGVLLLVPSVAPNRLDVIVDDAQTPSYNGLPECAAGLLKTGKQGRLSEDCARCVRYGSLAEGAFRTLDWSSIVFCPLMGPGRTEGAMFFWRGAGNSAFSDAETSVLEQFAELCAPLPLSMAINGQFLFDRDIAAHLNDAVVVADEHLTVLRWNPAAERLYGIPAEEAVGSPLGSLYSTFYDDPEMDTEQAWAQLQSTGHWQGYVTQRCKSNKTVSVHATVTSITDETGRLVGAVGINRDNSELVQARSRIRVAEGMLAAALDAAGAMAVVLDDRGTIVAANREWLDSALNAGARMDRVGVGANYPDALRRATDSGRRDAALALASIEAVFSGQVQHASSEYEMETPTGMMSYQVDVRRIGTPPGAVITHREISEHRRLERVIARFDTHDRLTGLGNRKLLEDRIESAVSADGADSENMGLIICDVDGFAAVNEALGYASGDDVLRLLGAQLRELCPPGHTAYRLGGDQFAVFVASTTEAELSATADALRRELGTPLVVSGQGIRLTFSLGLATVGPDPSVEAVNLASALITRADAARIESKLRGRNRMHKYRPELHERNLAPLTLPHEFLTDLHAGNVHLYYQQIRRLADDEIVGFEGLLRWDRKGAVVPASAFGSLLTAPLVADPLAQWCVARVTGDAARLTREHPDRKLHLGVNFSAQQFLDSNIADAMRSAIARVQLPASAIVVEVTETTTFTDDQRVLGQLQQMREHGISIALDDFGTGFSSLQHLRSLPVNAVKVDRSFTAAIGEDSTSESLVRSLIGLAHDLQLWVVAEGVETAEQRDWLAGVGCDFYQGYYAHKPASLAECLRGLSERQD